MNARSVTDVSGADFPIPLLLPLFALASRCHGKPQHVRSCITCLSSFVVAIHFVQHRT